MENNQIETLKEQHRLKIEKLTQVMIEKENEYQRIISELKRDIVEKESEFNELISQLYNQR